MVKAPKTIIFRRSENSPVREKRRGFSPSLLLKPHPTRPPRSADYDWHDVLKRDCAQEIKRCKKLGLPERVRTNAQAVLKESVQQAEASVVSQKSLGGGAWGPGLGAGGCRGLVPGPAVFWGPGWQSGLATQTPHVSRL